MVSKNEQLKFGKLKQIQNKVLKYNKILIILFFASITSYALTCFGYWLLHPELSQMEIFLKFWYWFLINIILVGWFIKADLN